MEWMRKVKKELLMKNSEFHMNAVSNIIANLKCRKTGETKNFIVNALAENDIITEMCRSMEMYSDPTYYMECLNCLLLLTNEDAFYKSASAHDAIDAIVTVICFSKVCSSEDILMASVKMLYCIIKKSEKVVGAPCVISDATQMLSVVERLNALIRTSQCCSLKVLVSRLLLAVNRASSNLGKVDSRLISAVFESSLHSITQLIAKKYYENIEEHELYIVICELCAVGIRLCNDSSNRTSQNTFSTELIDYAQIFIDSAYNVVKSVIIPYLRTTVFPSRSQLTAAYKHFLNCLCLLYKNANSNIVDLSMHLASNGYLRFLFTMAINVKSIKSSAYKVLARVLTNLGASELPLENWPNGLRGFQLFLLDAFMSLPTNFQELPDRIGERSAGADALLILTYNHYIYTNDSFILSLDALVMKVVNSAIGQTIQPAILKALWLLIASFAQNEKPSTKICKIYAQAVTELSNQILTASIDQVYTHSPLLLKYTLSEVEIPQELRIGVISLWLKQSNGDFTVIYEELQNKIVLFECLMDIAISGDDDCLKKTVTYKIDELLNCPKNSDLLKMLWRQITLAIKNYIIGNVPVETLKILFKLIPAIEWVAATEPVLNDTVVQLSTLIQQDIKHKLLKYFALELIFQLVVTAEMNNFNTIVKTMLDNNDLMKLLCVNAFSEADEYLAAGSAKLMACLCMCQHIYIPKCILKKKIVQVEWKKIMKFLDKTENNLDQMESYLKLLVSLLLACTQRSLFKLEEFKNEAEAYYVIFPLYNLLHTILMQNPLFQDGPSLCMVSILNYCRFKKWKSTIDDFCLFKGTHYLIEIMTTNDARFENRWNLRFVQFLMTWLECRYDRRMYGCNVEEEFHVSLNRIAKFICEARKLSTDEKYIQLLMIIASRLMWFA